MYQKTVPIKDRIVSVQFMEDDHVTDAKSVYDCFKRQSRIFGKPCITARLQLYFGTMRSGLGKVAYDAPNTHDTWTIGLPFAQGHRCVAISGQAGIRALVLAIAPTMCILPSYGFTT